MWGFLSPNFLLRTLNVLVSLCLGYEEDSIHNEVEEISDSLELQQGDQKATQYGMLVMLLGQEFVGNVDRPDKHFVSKSNWPPPRWDG